MNDADFDKRAEEKLDDATRAAVTFNGAGIAGIIALLQRQGPVQIGLKYAGLFFLGGIVAAIGAWIIGMVQMNQGADWEVHMTWRGRALIVSIGLFAVAILQAIQATFAL